MELCLGCMQEGKRHLQQQLLSFSSSFCSSRSPHRLLANADAVALVCCFYSYRFMDMFPDTALVREIQQDLDQTIQQGVLNITRLIRANDPAVANIVQAHIGKPQANSSRVPRAQRSSEEGMDSSLAGRLVRDGLLTPDLLRQLQREWSKNQNQGGASQSTLNNQDHPDESTHKSGKRKKKK